MAVLVPPDREAWIASLQALGDTPGACRNTEPLTPASGPVCVTGASGFIALHLVEQLLEKGYTVVGTLRSLDNEAKLAPLRAFQEKYGKEKLRLVGGVDCTKPETFADAVVGCTGVFHTASPFHYKATDPLKELVEPAVLGTTGCLDTCHKAGVRRVVVTSSFASIINPGNYPWDYTYSSKDWNVTSFPNSDGTFPAPSAQTGYRFSKVAAEKAAWDCAAKEGCPFDLVCINPPLVIGRNHNKPKTVDDLNSSSQTVLKILTGQQAPNPNSIGWVDVADVAKAHIYGYEHVEAGGKRFLCAADTVPTWTEAAEMFKELYPAAPVITTPPEAGAGVKMALDTSALKALSGFEFKPLLESFQAQCESCIEQGFAKL